MSGASLPDLRALYEHTWIMHRIRLAFLNYSDSELRAAIWLQVFQRVLDMNLPYWWTHDHDFRLLVAMLKHGFGFWHWMLNDAAIKLTEPPNHRPQPLLAGMIRPNDSYVIGRADGMMQIDVLAKAKMQEGVTTQEGFRELIVKFALSVDSRALENRIKIIVRHLQVATEPPGAVGEADADADGNADATQNESAADSEQPMDGISASQPEAAPSEPHA